MKSNQLRTRQYFRAFSLVLFRGELICPVTLEQAVKALVLLGRDWQGRTFKRNEIGSNGAPSARRRVDVSHALHPLAQGFASFGQGFGIGFRSGFGVTTDLLA
jgi:hypothetical protein